MEVYDHHDDQSCKSMSAALVGPLERRQGDLVGN